MTDIPPQWHDCRTLRQPSAGHARRHQAELGTRLRQASGSAITAPAGMTRRRATYIISNSNWRDDDPTHLRAVYTAHRPRGDLPDVPLNGVERPAQHPLSPTAFMESNSERTSVLGRGLSEHRYSGGDDPASMTPTTLNPWRA